MNSYSEDVQDKDVNAEAYCVSNQVKGLVCYNQSEGRVRPHIYSSTTLEVPQVHFQGQSLSGTKYQVFPFSLALSPRTFTKCMDAALSLLQFQSIHVLNYVDEILYRIIYLILAQSEEMAVPHRDVVLAHMRCLRGYNLRVI